MKKKQTKTKFYIGVGVAVLFVVGAFVFLKQKGPSSVSTNEKKDYFIQMALLDSVNKEEFPLFRWTKTPVKIGVHDVTLPGDAPFASTADFDSCLNRVITDFNNISQEVKLKRTYWYPEDIAIAVTQQDRILSYVEAYEQVGAAEYVKHLKESAGFVQFGISEDYSMNFTLLVMAPELVEPDKKCALLYHEMMHAFGFPNHNTASDDPQGVLTDGAAMVESFSDFDKMLIDTMYNSGVPTGIDSEQIRESLNENSDSLD